MMLGYWHLRCIQKLVIDIGTNIGQSTMIILLSNTIKKVLLIEPNHKALAIAAENLILNNLSMKANFICAFASDSSDDSIRFWTIGTSTGGSIVKSHAKYAAAMDSYIDVSTITVDVLCDYYNIIPDLIKIDAESVEYDVLVGCQECASHQQTRFHLEMHSSDELSMSENAKRILHWCEKNKYQAWYLKEGIRLISAKQIEHRGRCHLLLQPQQWTYPMWLKDIKQGSPLKDVNANENNS